MQQEVLNKLSEEIMAIFSEFFTMEHFPCPKSERSNPFGKLIRIQKLVVTIQQRIVISEDDVDKLIRKTTKQRPSDLDDIRRQEIGLRIQTQLLELARYLQPGSLDHYVGDMWAREQLKTGSNFNDAEDNNDGDDKKVPDNVPSDEEQSEDNVNNLKTIIATDVH
jgi:E3 ubiquitin-protein ligase DOA10